MKDYKFYPMITQTLKSVLSLANPVDMWDYVGIIVNYPDYELNGDIAANPITDIIIKELDRQYARWNKGGKNETAY